jgi:hypothetical protein
MVDGTQHTSSSATGNPLPHHDHPPPPDPQTNKQTQPHQGNNVKLDKFKDKKVILVVNVASQCAWGCCGPLPSCTHPPACCLPSPHTQRTHAGGFTPQYKELQTLQDKYADKGFMVLAFPCNQFGVRTYAPLLLTFFFQINKIKAREREGGEGEREREREQLDSPRMSTNKSPVQTQHKREPPTRPIPSLIPIHPFALHSSKHNTTGPGAGVGGRGVHADEREVLGHLPHHGACA